MAAASPFRGQLSPASISSRILGSVRRAPVTSSTYIWLEAPPHCPCAALAVAADPPAAGDTAEVADATVAAHMGDMLVNFVANA